MSVSVSDGRLDWVAGLDTSPFDRNLDRLQGRINGVSAATREQASLVQEFANKAASAVATYFSISAAKGFVDQLVRVRGEFEQLQVALTTIIGSRTQADQVFQQVVKLAETTPFNLTDVAQGTKQLLAYGFAADDVVNTIAKLGDVAAGVSQPIGDIAYLYGTLKVQGRAYAQDIRQFTGRGIPIIAELAKQFNTTETNVNKLVEAGKVGFPEIETAFNSLTGAGGKFFNMMNEQSKTVTGQISNLGDQFDQLLNSIGRENQGLIISGIQGLSSLVANYQSILNIIEELIIVYGSYRVAQFALNTIEKVSQQTALGYSLALNQESVAKIASAQASLEVQRAEIGALAAKKASTIQTAAADRALLISAQERVAAAKIAAAADEQNIYSQTRVATATELRISQEELLAVQERASISRKAALTASSEFYTAQQELETTAKVASTAASVELTAAETVQTTATIVAGKAYDFLNKTMLSNPYVLLTVGFAAMGKAIYDVAHQTDYAAQASQNFTEEMSKEDRKLGQLFATLESTKAGTEERRKAVEAIKGSYEQYLPKMDLEKANLKDIENAYEQVNVKLRDNIALKAKAQQTEIMNDDFAKKQGDIVKDLIGDIEKEYGARQAGRASVVINKAINDALNKNVRLGFGNDIAAFGGQSEAYRVLQEATARLTPQLTGRKESNVSISEYLNQLQVYVDRQRRAQSSLKTFYDGVEDLTNVGKTKLNDAQKAAIAFQDALKDPVANFGTLIKNQTGKVDLEAINKALDEALNVPGIAIKKVEQIHKMQDQVDAALSVFNRKTGQKLAQQEEDERTRRNRIFDKVAKLNKSNLEASKTEDQREVLQARAKYDDLLREIDRYNASRKNKIKIDPNNINVGGRSINLNSEADKAGENIRIKQQFEVEKQGYEELKAVFEEYEKFKLDVGSEMANKRYANDLRGFTSYLNYLENLQKTVQGKADPNSVLLQDFLKSALPAARKQDIKNNQDYLQKLIVDNIDYETERKLIVQKGQDAYKALIAAGENGAAENVKKGVEKRLTDLDKGNVEQLDAYKELFDGLQQLTTDATNKNIASLRKYIDAALKAGTITKEAYLTIKKALDEAQLAVDSKSANQLNTVAQALGNIASQFSNISSEISGLLNGLSGLAGGIGNVLKLGAELKNATTDAEKFNSEAGLITAGVSGIAQVVGVISSSAKQRKEAEEAYYKSIINFQNQYNLSLNEQIRLRSELDKNVFLNDYKASILDATLALADANQKFDKSLLDLQGGKAKVGQRDRVDAGAIAQGAAGGALAGAALGSIVPVIGTIAGGVVGGIVGAIGGIFGGKKKKDIYSSLLGEYPELVYKAADGTEKFNDALAKNLIENNLVDDSTKGLLQNTIALNEARQAAIEQINSTISTLAGNLGDDLRNSLVQAFKDGTDAANAFGDSVSKVIENIISQFLFNEIFSDDFDKLQERMKESFALGGDQSFTDDIIDFYKNALPQIDLFNKGLEAANQAGKDYGLNVFDKTGKGSQNSAVGSISASLTEDTASIIAGTLKGIQLGVYNTNNLLTSQGLTLGQMIIIAQDTLSNVLLIEANTRRTADNTEVLPSMLDELKGIGKASTDQLDVQLRAAGFYKY